MAIPTTGPVSMGMIRNELGMPTATNFSLINASIGGVAGYPTLNPFSPVKPTNTPPEYKISEWRGYSSVTIKWLLIPRIITNPTGGSGNLKIFVNNSLVLDVVNPIVAGQRLKEGTIILNNNDTFSVYLNTISRSSTTILPNITITRYLVPLGSNNQQVLSSTDMPTPVFFNPNQPIPNQPFSSPVQIATIQPIHLGAFSVTAAM
jgi:hypothetical protein